MRQEQIGQVDILLGQEILPVGVSTDAEISGELAAQRVVRLAHCNHLGCSRGFEVRHVVAWVQVPQANDSNLQGTGMGTSG